MAEIDYYKTYAVISSTNEKNNNEIEEILAKVENLDNCAKFEDARKYLDQTFEMPSTSSSFSISGQFPIKIVDTANLHVIKIVVKEHNFTYCYKKGV